MIFIMILENTLGYHMEADLFLLIQELEYINCIKYFKTNKSVGFLVFSLQKESFVSVDFRNCKTIFSKEQ